jgi:tRNA threonylcarbamoyladenosine biosynthesis protein TsaB
MHVNLLAIDTATEGCSAAVLAGSRLVTRYMEAERGHAEQILSMVDAALAEAEVSLKELDAIAFGRGPGGFTGVRLAASVAQGLAFGANVRVIPISDLAAVAQRVLDNEAAAQAVLVCNDARMQEVYWAYYERNGAGLATLRGNEAVAPPDAVELPGDARSPIHGAGRGFRAYPQLGRRLQSLEAIHEAVLPRAGEIVRLAVTELKEGRTVRPEQAIPVYLRDQVARPAARG